jgi:hypothetical protein
MGSFLKNSDDIIIDAVLTTQGRYYIAEGKSSQKITQFALFDDEIDYSLYRSKHGCFGEEHASGSAYFDLDILQRPVLEAFTRGSTCAKSKLVTLDGNPDYLPIIRPNYNRRDHFPQIDSSPTFGAESAHAESPESGRGIEEGFVVIFDEDTLHKLNGLDFDANVINSYSVLGERSARGINFLNAYQPSSQDCGGCISVEQGINSLGTSGSPITPYDVDEYLNSDYGLWESDFYLQFNPMFGFPCDIAGAQRTPIYNTMGAFDLAAPKFETRIRTEGYTSLAPGTLQTISPQETTPTETVIAGPRSYRLNFKVTLGNGTYVDFPLRHYPLSILHNPDEFDKLGVTLSTEVSITMFGEDVTYATAAANSPYYMYKYVDTEIKIISGTTGYEVTIPLRYLKLFK